MLAIKVLILAILAIAVFVSRKKGNPKATIAFSAGLLVFSIIPNADIHNIPEGIECFIQGFNNGYSAAGV
ncbi:hypothetical protein ACMAZF_00520 [Psychrobium sp. nBUS_13]|uniref:hypothetical protein n=1 Tax=Psychrobium sp. nBUS_13 TaxID=3395319 RepID=UPI003EB91794